MTNVLTMQSSTEADTAALYNLSIDEIVQRIKAMQRQEKTSSSLYNKDYLSVVLQQQQQQQHQQDGLPSLLQLSPNTTIEQIIKQHIESRTKMAQWCYQLTDICNLSRHAVTRAMAFLDRYLATIVSNNTNSSNSNSNSNSSSITKALTDQRHYQLLSMTSLYITIKIHEPLAMDASLLSEISAGCYTTHEILDMERHMLSVTRWCGLHDCTHQEYITLLLGLCNPKWYRYNITVLGCVVDVALYQVELATCDYYLMNGNSGSNSKKSEVALASILNALERVNDEEWSSDNVKYEFVMRLVEVLSLDDDNENDIDGDVDMMMTRVADIQDRLRKLFCCQNSDSSNDSSGNNAMAIDDDNDDQQEEIPQEDEEEDYRCSSHYSKKNSSSSSMRCATNTNTNTSTSNHGTSSRRSRRTTSSSSSTQSSRRRKGSSSSHHPQEVIVVNNKKCTAASSSSPISVMTNDDNIVTTTDESSSSSSRCFVSRCA